MLRVLLAEDSVTIRDLLTAIMRSDGGIEVVGQASDGLEAVELAKRLRPDLVVMDIHMPNLDGFEATKRIMIEAPTPIIIVTASVDAGGVEVSLNALRAGALTIIRKPAGPASSDFEHERGVFLDTIRSMSQVKVVRHWPERAPVRPTPVPGRENRPKVGLVCIAASTGGPAALNRVLLDLPPDFPAPILIVQHMAAGFIEGLAQWLNKGCALRVKVAEDGEALAPGTVYLAPDAFHLGLGGRARVALSPQPPIGGFRPAGTFLFKSAAEAFGPQMIAVVLTGMGEDGVDGLAAVHERGGRVIAQDEASSVVYGMPKAAAASGRVHNVLPLALIAARLVTLAAAKES